MSAPSPAGTGREAEARPMAARFALRITDARVLTQAFFLALFLFLFWVTWFSRLQGYPVSLFLELDPLVALATAFSTSAVYRNLAWSLWLLLPALLLGRWFCGWMCPFGTLHHLTGWLFARFSGRERLEANAYRPLFRAKYVILVFLLAAAAMGSVQLGWLDPICLLSRSLTTAAGPVLDLATARARDSAPELPEEILVSPGVTQGRVFSSSLVIGWMVLALLAANCFIPRFFCRTLCPLGALLGIGARFALWRIDRSPDLCTHCNLCLVHCEGASDPHALLRSAECYVCMNCVLDCPEGALAFRFVPPPASAVEHVDTSRRHLVFGAATALLSVPLARIAGTTGDRTFPPKLIRPPGSPAEPEFLERCVKCAQCMRVCPTNVLQPASLDTGLESLWTPVMDMRAGYCEVNCTLCGHVCPTGAILPLTIERKLGQPPHREAGPVRVGTAFVDRGRCLPWAMETPCVVCEEVCPTSPKAIGGIEEEVTRWDGKKVRLRKPVVRPELCTGCGICEHVCPADPAAIVVQPGGRR